ncbi:Serine/threonine-protein kinase PknD [Planctomycetes bacterium Pan216]|uniref:Serine/threonine-protein kinase PknD n=1 Tax=Kolteria novifilia TaxID=2527975 RepID=A0A518BBY7_9BACT|nr:Serine/threonine-protein kinase PknD [Planctomycetes bacterium Pan216]
MSTNDAKRTETRRRRLEILATLIEAAASEERSSGRAEFAERLDAIREMIVTHVEVYFSSEERRDDPTDEFTTPETERVVASPQDRRDGLFATPPTLPSRYRALNLLGKGGLGEVWEVHDVKMNRRVALKRLRDSRGHNDARDRFLREAVVTGQLEHPSIVAVHELANVDDPFYTMSILRGESLEQAIKAYHKRRRGGEDHESDRQRLVDVFARACEAVACAHCRGIIHRDLKPSNIMLGEHGEVSVVDWGLAKRLEPDPKEVAWEQANAPKPSSLVDSNLGLSLSDENPSNTEPGSVLGTPAYLSPEQARGDHDAITTSADIFCLGGILFAILTGHPPHLLCVGESKKEFLVRVAEGEIRRPREINVHVSPALEAIALKAMRREPEDRYRRVEEMLADLRSWQACEPISVFRESMPQRLARWIARRRLLALAAAFGLIASLIVATTLIVGSIMESTERTREISRNLQLMAGRVEADLEFRLNEMRNLTVLLAEMPSSHRRLAKDHDQSLEIELADLFIDFMRQQPRCMQMMLLDSHQETVLRVVRPDLKHMPVVEKDGKLSALASSAAREAQQLAVGGLYTSLTQLGTHDTQAKDLSGVSYFSSPVYALHQKQPLGTVVLGWDLALDESSIPKGIAVTEDGISLTLASPTGLYVVGVDHADGESRVQAGLVTSVYPELAPLFNHHQGPNSLEITTKSSAPRVIFARKFYYNPNEPSRYVVLIISHPLDQMLSNQRWMIGSLAVIIGGIILVVVGIAIAITRALLQLAQRRS